VGCTGAAKVEAAWGHIPRSYGTDLAVFRTDISPGDEVSQSEEVERYDFRSAPPPIHISLVALREPSTQRPLQRVLAFPNNTSMLEERRRDSIMQ
jgi:hypothetical protein